MSRPSVTNRWLTGVLLCSAGLLSTFAASAQDKDAGPLRLRALAATCAQCHGTDGRAVAGEVMVRLAGLPQDYLRSQLMAFRSGERKATVMHQITKGYSQAQLESLATYFAAQK